MTSGFDFIDIHLLFSGAAKKGMQEPFASVGFGFVPKTVLLEQIYRHCTMVGEILV